MKMNFKGLVDLHTLPKTTPLLPLYEAIINSIQSIEDAQISNGKIEIIVEREKQMNLFNQWETDIENIIIVDNGIGFNDENYNSFDTYASEYKVQKGCKGVGRMMWLKAFCNVSIESIFVEEDKKKCRTFLFDANHAVHDMKITELSSEVLQTTKVRLNGLREQYKGNCPKKLETIAKNILNHCFTYYVLGKAPKIIVSDEKDTIDIDELYKGNIGDNIKIDDIDIKGTTFKIIHSKNYMNSKDKHTMNFCANHWVVQPVSLTKIMGNASAKLNDENGEFIYNGYIMSELLDRHVNRERTKIELPEQFDLVENVGMNDIAESVEKVILDYLKKDIEDSNKKKKEMIQAYVFGKNPKYRMLLKNKPEIFNEIPWVVDEEKLEKVFKENNIESVIHFAGLKAVGESVVKPIEYYHNNITGTLVLLKLMKKYNCKRIVFSSSATVYGDPEIVPITEECKTGGTTNPYGTTKLFIERILQDVYVADNEFSIALLRYFNPIGAHESGLIGEDPNDIPNNLMPYITGVASGKLEILSVFGNDYPTKDGTGVRDYIHVVDLAKGHLKALAKIRQEAGVKIYNLGTGHGYSVLDLVNTFQKVNNVEVKYKIVGRRAGDIATCYADPSKAKKELGWVAEKGIEDMCRDSWNFIVSNK